VCADFAAYVACQNEVSRAYLDRSAWTASSVLNVARVGYFSSDRAIHEYADRIWHVDPVPVTLG
jgi:starch phosphorylase